MKIVTILGARPQFIKAAVVSRAFSQINKEGAAGRIQEIIIHTGQHYDTNMSDIFFQEMEIPAPAFTFDVNQMSHGAMTGRMLELIEKALLDEEPDWVLVYGDTDSTLAGALAAVKLHIPVAHVEAGLRSYNKLMPEEHNRVLTDHISLALFCPTRRALENLRQEGLGDFHETPESNDALAAKPHVYEVGDVMYDAALYYSGKSSGTNFPVGEDARQSNYRQFALATVHREENTDQKESLEQIVDAFCRISEMKSIVWPVHPRTRKMLSRYQLDKQLKRDDIFLMEPVGYLEMLGLLQKCCLVLTDSGGLQKEAYFFQKPCVTLRNETEWVELVDHGFNKVVGTNPDSVVNSVVAFLKSKIDYNVKLYGSGDAGQKIATVLQAFFTN